MPSLPGFDLQSVWLKLNQDDQLLRSLLNHLGLAFNLKLSRARPPTEIESPVRSPNATCVVILTKRLKQRPRPDPSHAEFQFASRFKNTSALTVALTTGRLHSDASTSRSLSTVTKKAAFPPLPTRRTFGHSYRGKAEQSLNRHSAQPAHEVAPQAPWPP